MIEQLSREYPIQELCRVLEVARSGYYRWLEDAPRARDEANGQLTERIRAIYHAQRGL